MKLYREVKNRKADYCAWPINEDLIHEDHVPIEIIEITEEEIETVLKENLIEGTYGTITSKASKAILSKLKGE